MKQVTLDVLVQIFRDYFKPELFPNSTLAPNKVKHLIREFRTKQSGGDYKMQFNNKTTEQQQVNPGRAPMSVFPGVQGAVNDGNEVNNNNNDEGYKNESSCVLQ